MQQLIGLRHDPSPRPTGTRRRGRGTRRNHRAEAEVPPKSRRELPPDSAETPWDVDAMSRGPIASGRPHAHRRAAYPRPLGRRPRHLTGPRLGPFPPSGRGNLRRTEFSASTGLRGRPEVIPGSAGPEHNGDPDRAGESGPSPRSMPRLRMPGSPPAARVGRTDGRTDGLIAPRPVEEIPAADSKRTGNCRRNRASLIREPDLLSTLATRIAASPAVDIDGG